MESFDVAAQKLQDDKITEALRFIDTEKVFATTVDKFKPMQDYLVILIPKINKTTKQGFAKTQREVEKELIDLPQVFEVVAIGPNARKSMEATYSNSAGIVEVEHSDIKIGQYVLCTRINSVPVQSNKEGFEVAVVRMFDVIGVFDEI